jgi:hypothetical protein
MTAAWPTLSRAPIVGGNAESVEDNVIASKTQVGPDVTRIANTRPYRPFSFRYVALAASDLAILRATYNSYAAEFMTWTHPDGTLWYVRQDAPYQIQGNPGRDDLYDVSVSFRAYSGSALGSSIGKLGGLAMPRIEELAPGVGFTGRPVFCSGYNLGLVSIDILTEGPPEGIDNSNTVVLTVKKGDGATVVTKTFNTATQPPDKGRVSLGTLLATSLESDDFLTLDMVQTGTAKMPAFYVVPTGEVFA